MSYTTNTPVSFPLAIGQVFAVRTQLNEGAIAKVYGATSNPEYSIPQAASKTYGPFTEAKTVVVAPLSGTVDYDYGAPASVSLPAYSYTPAVIESVGDPGVPMTYNPITGSADQASAVAIRGAASKEPITLVGDSIDYTGVRDGATVPTGLIWGGGVNVFLASVLTNTAATGLLEWSLSTRSLRYTAPGDTPGPWVPMTRTQRFRIASANGLWLKGSYFADIMVAQATTSQSISYTSNPYVASMMRGVPEWLQFFRRNGLQIDNLCVPGASIRHMPDILLSVSNNPGRVFAQIGTNDVIQERTPAQIEADFEAIAPTLVGLGAVVRSIPAINWGTQAKKNAWNAINNTVVPALCAEYGIPFLPIWGASIDPSSTTLPKANRLQADNTHPAAPGALYAALQLDPYVPSAGVGRVPFAAISAYDATHNPLGNLIANAGFSGTLGVAQSGVNITIGGGSLPTGFAVEMIGGGSVTGCTAQLVAAADGGNPWIELAVTGAAAGTQIKIEDGGIAVHPGSTVPVPGQAITGIAEWQYVLGSGGALRGVEVRLQPVTTTAPVGYAGFVADAMVLPDVAIQGVTPTPETAWAVPPGATAVRHQTVVTFGAGNATVRIRNPVMRILA